MATHYVRKMTGGDFEVSYMDGLWTRRIGRDFISDGPAFRYPHDLWGWKHQMERYAEDTKEYWLQHYRPQEGNVIVDVGAGRGEDTLTFSRGVGSRGRVIAIEAHAASFSALKNFCRLNVLTNVTALHLALMDKPGMVRIAESESSWMENAIDTGSRIPGVEIRADTLDRICVELDQSNRFPKNEHRRRGAVRAARNGINDCPYSPHLCGLS
jgi:FkbM family methyltransferase